MTNALPGCVFIAKSLDRDRLILDANGKQVLFCENMLSFGLPSICLLRLVGLLPEQTSA